MDDITPNITPDISPPTHVGAVMPEALAVARAFLGDTDE